ncbi:unnamed protein product [Clonostachys rosea]|uniref:Xylanolytic transcriptional activator regulatory domain-containing protein n=1 Tax=Bionectria ochroleuca TaxID=29856 RepID=A0ABY6TVM7_BIOOC|nr:unnamed protein product [Clonostachys rosea]
MLLNQTVRAVQAHTQSGLATNNVDIVAYILTGTAIRLAFSIGLNIESVHSSLSCDVQEARRTYWMMYIQDFELSLDSGRPFSMSASQMRVSYPAEQPILQGGSLSQPSPTRFIRHLADFVGISRKILKLFRQISKAGMPGLVAPVEIEILRKDLMHWRASLPDYLQFDLGPNDMHENVIGQDLYAWHKRQQSSLRIRRYLLVAGTVAYFNLAIIILLQGSREKKDKPKRSDHEEPSLASFHQLCRLDAARDMIRHIYKLFETAPRLRRWSYYCFYCLQATLVLLPKVAESHYIRRNVHHVHGSPCSCQWSKYRQDWKICSLSFKIFEMIDLKASQTCGEAVRRFLKGWEIPDTGECPHNICLVNSEGGGELQSHSASLTSAIRPDRFHKLPGTNDLFSSPLDKSSQSHAPLADSEGISRVDDPLAIVSSPISLSGIQVELYEALYGKYDQNNFESATGLGLATNDGHLGLSSDVTGNVELDWFDFCNVDTDNNYMATQ